ncbi:MAG: phosphatidylserine decarboxylase [Bacteriovoracaceae bacterium]
MQQESIKYYNRSKSQMEVEKIYGDGFLRWLYTTAMGKALTKLFCKAPLSKVYGLAQDSTFLSKKKVRPFISDFNIKIDDFQAGSIQSDDVRDSYATFNEFFIRPFKSGKRNFVQGKEMPAFAEARYLGFESISPNQKFPVKGEELSASALLANGKWMKIFDGGPLMIARLCPVDYHRFHFPDKGTVLDDYRISGQFHSVNPIALRFRDEVFSENERHVTIFETENFGKMAYIEVGAIMVGKIIQSYQGKNFLRGQEKGYFLFGASTVIVLGEKGKWKPSADMLEYSKKEIEVYLQLGDSVGVAI